MAQLRNQVKNLQEASDVSTVKINKGMLHKELLSKDLINQDNFNLLNRNYNIKSSSFGDLVIHLFLILNVYYIKIQLNDQYKISKRAKKVAKYAYKWLNIVRERKKLIKMQ